MRGIDEWALGMLVAAQQAAVGPGVQAEAPKASHGDGSDKDEEQGRGSVEVDDDDDDDTTSVAMVYVEEDLEDFLFGCGSRLSDLDVSGVAVAFL